MPITILDGILIGVTLFSAVLAMVRGFSREVLSVASWVAAAAAAYYFYPLLVPYVIEYTPGKGEQLAMAVSAGIIFLVALIVVSVLTMRIADFVIDSRIGALDRTLGFVFGAITGRFAGCRSHAVSELAHSRPPPGTVGRGCEIQAAAGFHRRAIGEYSSRRRRCGYTRQA